jgi:hypothetical protein
MKILLVDDDVLKPIPIEDMSGTLVRYRRNHPVAIQTRSPRCLEEEGTLHGKNLTKA